MSIVRSRLSGWKVLQNIRIEPNLCMRCYSSILGSNQTFKRDLVSSFKNECLQVPHRSYHKHLVEVEKRIQYNKPVKVPCILPEQSGDLSGLPDLDLSNPPTLFKKSQELQTADELVKRVFSLRFQPREPRKLAFQEAMANKVRRHHYDTKSVEVKIARWTAIIRNMQVHTSKFPRDRKARADLKELIDFRKKRMKVLRCLHYQRFEWLLVNLDILYKPVPAVCHLTERRDAMKRLAEEYMENLKQQSLEQYKAVLDSKKKEFLEKKLSTMKTIIEEENSIGVEPSFSSEDIKRVEQAIHDRTVEDNKLNPVIEKEVETY